MQLETPVKSAFLGPSAAAVISPRDMRGSALGLLVGGTVRPPRLPLRREMQNISWETQNGPSAELGCRGASAPTDGQCGRGRRSVSFASEGRAFSATVNLVLEARSEARGSTREADLWSPDRPRTERGVHSLPNISQVDETTLSHQISSLRKVADSI
jgi:hypothetical protein